MLCYNDEQLRATNLMINKNKYHESSIMRRLTTLLIIVNMAPELKCDSDRASPRHRTIDKDVTVLFATRFNLNITIRDTFELTQKLCIPFVLLD